MKRVLTVILTLGTASCWMQEKADDDSGKLIRKGMNSQLRSPKIANYKRKNIQKTWSHKLPGGI